MSTPALSPRLREHSHTSQNRSSRPMPTPKSRSTHARTPSAAGALSARPLNTPNHVSHDVKTPSPNYFGLSVDPSADCFASSAAQHIRGNWSPPTSNVGSIAAASPRIVPVDQNPQFDQFRRQSENHKGFVLNKLSETGTPQQIPSSAAKGPLYGLAKPSLSPKAIPPPSPTKTPPETKENTTEGTAKPRSPKRLLSSDSQLFPNRPRRNSPASFLERSDEIAEFVQDRNPRPSLPAQQSGHAHSLSHHRAETLPLSLESENKTEGPVLMTPQHVVNVLESAEEQILLLDLRVATQYATSRIAGALNLCMPTTLLKRPSFGVAKLTELFKDDNEAKEKFSRWKNSRYIIVYDSNSAQLKDATTCVHTLKKFTNEGWAGVSYIIRGGFQEFSNKFPGWITEGSTNSPTSTNPALQLDADLPAVAPVAGGCPMPTTQNAANPFFGNIRQNMDLIGGVGQMPIKHPAAMTKQVEEDLPLWLRKAANERDNGKLVSDKFLQIEKREQRRMQDALNEKVSFGSYSPGSDSTCIKITGVEKGSKNRYNNIWPYAHTKVKLQGVAEGGCDYVNANHIQAPRSNKCYIATQAPLPATFNDFWNVVWQQDVRVIVMLTAEQESGQIKAHNYWQDKQYGHLQLNFLGERRASLEPSKIHRHKDRPALGQRRATNPPKPMNVAKEASSPNSELPYVIVRKFTLSNGDQPFERMREITQLQYSSWPDFGAPAHATHLLGLIEQCDAVVRQVNGGHASRPDPPNGRPVVVHCSAGCGRTGTFCTVDSVVDMLKRQRQARNVRKETPMEIDASNSDGGSSFFKDDENWLTREDYDLIEKTVEEFRHQRLSMVQSLRQFVLCYESVLEWLVEQHPKSA